jgi:hypothetical protein
MPRVPLTAREDLNTPAHEKLVFVAWHQTALLVLRVVAAALTENLNQVQSVELSSNVPVETLKLEANAPVWLPKTSSWACHTVTR